MLVLLAAALLLRLPNLNQSLWYDEVVYSGAALQGESLRWVLTQDVHPPLYALVLWGWIQVAGESEIALRLPSLLCGLASVVVVLALAKRWCDYRVAVLAAALIAVSPAHIWYSQENKTNMLMLLLTALLVWAADRAWRTNRPRDWTLLAIIAVLAPWTNVFAIWVLAAVWVWLWVGALQPHGRTRLRPITAVTAAAACPFIPLFTTSLQHFETRQLSYLRPFTGLDLYKLFLIYLSHGNTLRTISPYASLDALLLQPWPYFLVDAFFALMLLSGVLRLLRRCATAPWNTTHGWSTVLPVSYLAIPLACVFLASRLNPHIYIERSMLILLPPYIIVIAAGVLGTSRPVLRNLLLAVLLVLNGCALYNLWVAKADRWTVYKPKNDWRSAAQYLAGEMGASRPLVLVASVPVSALSYYDHRILPVADSNAALPQNAGALLFYNYDRDPGSLLQVLQRVDTDTLYTIEDTYWSAGMKQLLERVNADADFQSLGNRTFKGVSISKFKLMSGHRAAEARPD